MTLTALRLALQEAGARPRASLGQNFLHDANLARWIAQAARPREAALIVEIGPGLGALTEPLLASGTPLLLLEKDRRLAAWLRQRLEGAGGEVVEGDALDFDLRALWPRQPVKIVSNLPYNVSTPLLEKFAGPFSPASELVLTLQKEVAHRLAAGPGSKDYGAMSVLMQRRWRVELLKILPPSVFYPRPKVSSAVVRLSRRAPESISPLDEEIFEELVRRGFSQRRKQLRNLLPEPPGGWENFFFSAGLPASCRAENLGLGQWESLAARCAPAHAQKGWERFDVVDEQDRVLGPQPRDVVHARGLRHRAVHILLFNAAGELFLQRRSLWKDLNPGRWDSSAAGHVDAGETYMQAAVREVREELGVEAPRLERLGKLLSSEATSWEFVEVFRGCHEGPFRLARLEVETGAFFPLSLIHTWLATRPQDFSPLFRLIWTAFGGDLRP